MVGGFKEYYTSKKCPECGLFVAQVDRHPFYCSYCHVYPSSGRDGRRKYGWPTFSTRLAQGICMQSPVTVPFPRKSNARMDPAPAQVAPRPPAPIGSSSSSSASRLVSTVALSTASSRTTISGIERQCMRTVTTVSADGERRGKSLMSTAMPAKLNQRNMVRPA